MKRSMGEQSARILRKLPAIVTSLASVTLLYVYFVPTPADADADESRVDVDKIMAAAAIPAPRIETADSATSRHAGNPESLAEVTPSASTKSIGGRVTNPAADDVNATRAALLVNLLLLEKGAERLSRVSGYTATFFKQERLGLAQGEGQVIELKLRHEPFSVYMKWLTGDKGRELLYVDGLNDGDMIVHPGGWKARLLPALKLDPEGSLAMRESRHPVTMVGLFNLARRIIDKRRNDLKDVKGLQCRMVEDQEINGRACYCFVMKYDSPLVSEEYRKTVQYVDKETCLPVAIKNYGWPKGDQEIEPDKLDEATLFEHYAYYDVRLNQQLADRDFDRNNDEYRFRR